MLNRGTNIGGEMRVPKKFPFFSAAAVGLAGLFPFLIPLAQTPIDLPTLVKMVAPSVVVIRTFDSGGRPVALGSGFLVDGGRVVTNAHVLQGAVSAEVFDSQGQLISTTDYAEALGRSVDLAVLPPVTGVHPILALAPDLPDAGMRVLVFGAPEGLSNTVSEGIISAVRTLDTATTLQITAPISHGSSGGPVVRMDGVVLGVSVATLASGQNLNFAVPARDVLTLLGSPTTKVLFPKAGVIQPSEGQRQPEVAPFEGRWEVIRYEGGSKSGQSKVGAVVTITRQGDLFYADGPSKYFSSTGYRQSGDTLSGSWMPDEDSLIDLYPTLPGALVRQAVGDIVYHPTMLLSVDGTTLEVEVDNFSIQGNETRRFGRPTYTYTGIKRAAGFSKFSLRRVPAPLAPPTPSR